MSTELKPVKDRNGNNILMTQFWGGSKYGICLQLTGKEDYISLNRETAQGLIDALKEWVMADRPEATEDEKS